jgi:hypothetical protein
MKKNLLNIVLFPLIALALIFIGNKAVANWLAGGLWGEWVLMLAVLLIASALSDKITDAVKG